MRRLLLLFLALAFFGTTTAQRISYDGMKGPVRVILASGKSIILTQQQCIMTLAGFANTCNHDTAYAVYVNAYLNNTDSCKLTFTTFDDEEISLYMSQKAVSKGLYDFLWGPTIIRQFFIKKEQLERLFTGGVLGIELTDGLETQWHSWKKDKLGAFLKKSYDKIQERFLHQK